MNKDNQKKSSDDKTIVKKYANRRLYNTRTSTYVTLDDLAQMVKEGEDFSVIDAKTSDDITHSVLTQIIFEQESKGENLLPIAVLRQLIGFYGDSMQSMVPSYLEYTMDALSQNQKRFREQMSQSMGVSTGMSAFETMQEQVKRNTEMFRKTMGMFVPMASQKHSQAEDEAKSDNDTKQDLLSLKEQLSQMQAQLNKIASQKD